jgi:hypothetical protein
MYNPEAVALYAITRELNAFRRSLPYILVNTAEAYIKELFWYNLKKPPTKYEEYAAARRRYLGVEHVMKAKSFINSHQVLRPVSSKLAVEDCFKEEDPLLKELMEDPVSLRFVACTCKLSLRSDKPHAAEEDDAPLRKKPKLETSLTLSNAVPPK